MFTVGQVVWKRGCAPLDGAEPRWTGQSPVPTQEESALVACGKNMQDLLQFMP
jgi:hypothetical protein